MSVTAIGPALDLDGPLPVPRRHSLLATPGVRRSTADRRWENGVVVQGYPAGTPLAWDPCATGTDRVKSEIADGLDDRDALPGGRFDSHGIYFPILCSSHGMRDPLALGDKVEAALDATLSVGVEAALAKGAAGSLNPFFGDTNMEPLSLVAVSPQVGLALLENAGAQITGRQFLIHATPAVISAWGTDDLSESDALRTLNGTIVVSGAGYIGAHPVGPGGLPGPGTTSDWVFATSLVEVYVDEEPRFEVSEVIDRTDNTFVYRAERYVLAEWDRSLQVGVLIDWSL